MNASADRAASGAGERRPGVAARLPWVVAFSILGVVGNYLALSVGFNVDFIFGSVAGLLAVVLLGPVLGTGASLAAAAYTLVLWKHPYAIAIFGCEALWLGLARRRRPSWPLFLVDLAYWLVLGTPLVFAFYYGAMNLGLRTTGIVALKQSLNGLTNAILVGVLLHLIPFHRWVGGAARPVHRTSQLYFESMAFLLLVPAIGSLMYVNHRDIRDSQRSLALRVKQAGSEVGWLVTHWLDQHRRAVELLARKGAEARLRRTPALQREVEEVHRLFPDFHNVLVADRSATTLAFDPPVNERGESTIGIGFADREWFHQLREARQTRVSDVFEGRGGVFKPIVAIAAPVLEDGELAGLGLGAVNLDRLAALTREITSSSRLAVTVLDRQARVVTSTDVTRVPLARFDLEALAGQASGVAGVHLRLPAARRNVSIMQVWQQAAYFTRFPVETAGWTVVVEGPLAPLQQRVYDDTIVNLVGIFLLLLLANGVALWFGRRLSRPLGTLAAISAGLPGKIESDGSIDWPSPETEETAALTANFRVTAEALRETIRSLRAHGRGLEQAVAERTAELELRAAEAREARVRAEALAREQAALLQAAPVGISKVVDRRQVWVNRRMVEMLGYPAEEMVGQTTRMLYPSDEAYRAVGAEAYAVLDSGRPFRTVQELIHKDGRRLWIEYAGLALDPGDPSKGTLWVLDDVTEERAAAAALAEAQRRLVRAFRQHELVLANAAMGIALVRDRRQIWVNARHARIFGYTVEELQGASTRMLYPSDQAFERLGREAYPLLSAGKAYVVEQQMQHKDGSILWVRLQGQRVDTADEGAGSIWCLEDITELKRLSARAASAARLASTGALVRGVAHEINSPLAGLASSVFYAREQLLALAQARGGASGADLPGVLSEVLPALDDATEAADKVRRIVADLRSFAIGDVASKGHAASLAAAVQDARRMAGRDLSRCASVEVDVPEEGGVAASHPELVQILAHLLSNAGQATGPGPNHVRIEGQRRDDGRCEIRVVDTGVGMSEEVLAHAFEPFYSTRGVGKGRGLGLSVCLGVVEAVGGEIRLQSEPGAGTTVTLLLPAAAIRPRRAG